MAGSLVHLAVMCELMRKYSFKDPDRIKFAVVVPDAGTDHVKCHFKHRFDDGKMSMYDLNAFKEMYGDKIMSDDVYLGYYLHLVQDAVYRQYVYNEHHWVPDSAEKVDKLHNDYALCNPHIIEKYGLKNDLKVPKDFYELDICKDFSFDADNFIYNTIKTYFEQVPTGEFFFFTDKMTDEYIERAVSICLSEIEALTKGEAFVNPRDYAWNREHWNRK